MHPHMKKVWRELVPVPAQISIKPIMTSLSPQSLLPNTTSLETGILTDVFIKNVNIQYIETKLQGSNFKLNAQPPAL